MQLEITHDLFADEAEATALAEAAGLNTVAVDFGPTSDDDHWHDFPAATYVVSGEVTITISDTNEACTLRAGSRITAPARLLHREKSEGFRAVIGLTCDPADLPRPITRLPDEFPA